MKASPFRRMNAVTLLLKVLLTVSLFSAIPLLVSCSGGGTPPTADEAAAGSGGGGDDGGGDVGSVGPTSIKFVSTDPDTGNISIAGGGQTESITITFQLLDADRNPIAGYVTDFKLLQVNGGEKLNNTQGISGVDGMVSTVLISGTQAGTVQVKAELHSDPTHVNAVKSVTINGGLPEGNHFLLSVIPANINGLMLNASTQQDVRAAVSDINSNPVPPDIQVHFEADYGTVTANGVFDSTAGNDSVSTVLLTNNNPQPVDEGYVQVMAQTIGGIHATVLSLAVDPVLDDIVYAGTDGGGVFKTTDAGLSWRHVGIPLKGSPQVANLTGTIVRNLVLDSNDRDVIYAATEKGVFVSTSGGEDWKTLTGRRRVREKVGDGFGGYDANDWSNQFFAFKHSFSNVRSRLKVYVDAAAVPTTAFIMDHPKSGDDETVATGFWLNADAGDISGGQDVVAEYDAEAAINWPVYALAVNPDSSDYDDILGHAKTIYAGTAGGGVWKTVNGGGLWTPASNPANELEPIGMHVKCLAINNDAPTELYAGTSLGLFKTVNGGVDWTKVKGTNETTVQGIVLEPASPVMNIWIIGENGVHYSTNGGATWNVPTTKPSTSDPTNTDLRAIVRDEVDGTLYVATYGDVRAGSKRGGVYTSMDNGVTWGKVPDLADSTGAHNLDSLAVVGKSGSDLLYAGSEGRSIFRSANSGNTWAAVNGESPNTLNNELFATAEALHSGDAEIEFAYLGIDALGGAWGGTIPNGATTETYIRVSDRLGNRLVAGTNITVSTSCGSSDSYDVTLGDGLKGGPGIHSPAVTDFYVSWTNDNTATERQYCCLEAKVVGDLYDFTRTQCFWLTGIPAP